MADVAERAPAANHEEYECPGCRELAEYRIVADVYGCTAGRHCVQVTPEQRIVFEQMIAKRLAASPADAPEAK